MPAPPSISGARSESQTWQELEDIFTALGRLARSPAAPNEFYRSLLDQSVRALSAIGGVVWLRAGNGALQPIAYSGGIESQISRDEQVRANHEALLQRAAVEGRVQLVAPPASGEDRAKMAGEADHVLVLGPVRMLSSESAADRETTVSIIEIWMRGDASPATYRGSEQFLTAVCELASDYHAFYELRSLRRDGHHHEELLQLSRQVHSKLSLSATAYAVANEGRRLVDCDRLSVLVARGRSCKLLAASGVSRVERRSGAARRLAKLAELVRQTNEPAYYSDGECDALPPVAEAIARHVEESHARHIAAIPVARPTDAAEDDAALSKKQRGRLARVSRPEFVLIAEQFDSRDGELRRDWLVETAQVAATGLYNAWEIDRLPLGWLWRSIGRATSAVTAHISRTVVAVAAVAGIVCALVLLPADFNIESPGTMQPVTRRDVFAPRSGVVDEVLVKHGDDVEAGQLLVQMRDPSLDLDLKRADGELETAQRQLDAIRSTKTNRAVRDTNPVESYRLSAEERELEQKVANLHSELELLKHDREQLVITSPIKGRVLTWDVGHELGARPVERGEVLVTVADLSADWQLDLNVPDDRIGYVLAAQQKIKPDLLVRFRLGSEERAEHTGKISEVCQTADVPAEKATRRTPTVLTKVALDTPELMKSLGGELRPGISARAQIACGRRPLGYVWLHDVWDAAWEWWDL